MSFADHRLAEARDLSNADLSYDTEFWKDYRLFNPLKTVILLIGLDMSLDMNQKVRSL